MSRRKALIFLLLSLIATNVCASGFGVFTQGAKGLGQANAVVAHPTGASSLYFNPALLTTLEGRQFEVGSTAIFTNREFSSSASGLTYDGDDDWKTPSTLYYTEEHGRLAAGIGLYFPFGLATTWPADYEGRYISTSADLFSLNINPVVAYRVSDRLSLAAGIDLLYLSTELNNSVNQVFAGFAIPPALGGPINDPTMPDVQQRFDGEGWGHGLNLGLTYRINDQVTFGATYRSQVDVEIDGSASFGQVDPRLALFFPATSGSADVHLPAQATAGLAMAITPELTVELGARWEGWSAFDELRVILDTPVLGQTASITPRNWDDTWAVNVGGEYHLTPTVALLAGYLYGQNPVPGSTFDPSIPDSDAQLLTIGTDITLDLWNLALAYGYEFHQDRIKNNSIGDPLDPGGLNPASFANGQYTADIHLVALSVSYAF